MYVTYCKAGLTRVTFLFFIFGEGISKLLTIILGYRMGMEGEGHCCPRKRRDGEGASRLGESGMKCVERL